jgi:ABC-type multidrug transport system ATPase subunit
MVVLKDLYKKIGNTAVIRDVDLTLSENSITLLLGDSDSDSGKSVFLKLLAGAIFEKHTSLVAAFSVTNPQEISAAVEVCAKYPLGDLSDKNKQFCVIHRIPSLCMNFFHVFMR